MKHYITLNYKESDKVFDFYHRSRPYLITKFYIHKKCDIDCSFEIVSLNAVLAKGVHYSFDEIFEVNSSHSKTVLSDLQSITLMFDSEEESLYFKLKYGGELNV